MRLLHACPHSCKRPRVDETASEPARERKRVLDLVDEMTAKGMLQRDALETIGLAKSTCHDWRKAFRRGGLKALAPKSTRPKNVRQRRWTDADDRAVLQLRAEHPFMGKARLKAMLDRRGVRLSVSTVGRIVAKAVADGRIKPASFCEGRAKPKRRRSFESAWAQRWKYGDKAKTKTPGQMVQIDHMTCSRDGQSLKEFRAVCPISKFAASRVFSRATAGNAKRFLESAIAAMPFPIKSIQVDGGSEFMADFESACQTLEIPLHVLPPRQPRWNGCVERANRSARIEFWNQYDGPMTVAAAAPALAGHEFFHNYQRPHWALDCRTPNEYLVHTENMSDTATKKSEMS